MPRSANSRARRAARSSTEAVRKNLKRASGSTTVPISRPAITTGPSAAIARCCSTIAARTPGNAATVETAAETSGSNNSVPVSRAVDLDAVTDRVARVGDETDAMLSK